MPSRDVCRTSVTRKPMSYLTLAIARLSLLSLVWLLVSCGNSNNGTVRQTGPAPNPQDEVQAIEQLLSLYRTAITQEDIDRLAELLQTGNSQARALPASGASRQTTEAISTDAQAFLAEMSTMFQTQTVLALEQQNVAIAANRQSVSFVQGESSINPLTLEHQTSLVRTTLQIARQESGGIFIFRISAVQRTRLAMATTPGQIQAGALTRLIVQSFPNQFPLTRVDVEVPEGGGPQALTAQGDTFTGVFTAPSGANPQPLRLRLQSLQGEVITFRHSYQLRVPGEGVVHRIPETAQARFAALTVAPDGAIWAGGNEPPRGGGTLYMVPAGASQATRIGDLLADPAGRVTDLAFDRLGRLHTLVFAAGSAVSPAVSRNDVRDRNVFCSTVNVFDPNQRYPLQVQDLNTGMLVPSPSTRVTAADAGAVWLSGSDGGVARVTDTFRDGLCPPDGVTVRYDPIFRRENSSLPTNVVPALVVSADGALWFGTALGLIRSRDGQATAVPFSRTPTVTGNVATLESFFQAVAEAIFAARPLTTVAIGSVSFIESFGQALVKEELIFSAVEDALGRLWVGTLGGGVRRIEARNGTFQDTLHFTQAEVTRLDPATGSRTVLSNTGLGSNIVFALAVSHDGTVWAATNAGLSRIQDRAGSLSITNFTALDGLTLPVRDVAIDPQGIAWAATDGGLFRVVPAGGSLQGIVQDSSGRSVANADVLALDSPFRAVTDANGNFVLRNVPPGGQSLRIDSALAPGGPFTLALRQVEVTTGTQNLTVTLTPLAPRVPVQPSVGGAVVFASVPGAQLDIAPQALQLPPGETAALGLTSIGLGNVPLPLPAGFTAAAAVDLQPHGALFTTPAQLTLPNTAQLPAGRLVVLLGLDAARLQYEELGRGRVSDDGTRISLLSVGIRQATTLVFATTAVTDGAQLVIRSGAGQSGTVGQLLGAPFVVAVQDRAGQGIPGVPITFTVRTGGGQLSTVTLLTDAQGQASSHLTLGTQAGGNAVEARAAGLASVFFTAMAQGDLQTADLISVSGNNQQGTPGVVLPEPLVIRLVDQFRNPLPGVEVRAAVIRGQAEFVSPAIIRTDALGSAEFRLRPLDMQDVFIEITAPQEEPVQFRIILGFRIGQSGYHITRDTDGSLLVVDARRAAIRRVHPTTGTSTTVSGCDKEPPCTPDDIRGTGIAFATPLGVAVEATGTLAVVDLFQGIIRVEPSTGNRSPVSGCEDDLCSSIRGQGAPSFPFFQSVAVEATGTLAVVNGLPQGIFRIDPQTGDRTIVSGCVDDFCSSIRGGGPDFVLDLSTASRLTIVDGALLLADVGMRSIVRVDPETGNRTVVSSDTRGTGRRFVSPRDLAFEAQGTLAVVDAPAQTVMRVNVDTGDRTIISGPLAEQSCIDAAALAGTGPCLDFPGSITVSQNRALIVVDEFLADGAVIQIDPVSGNRRILFFLRE